MIQLSPTGAATPLLLGLCGKVQLPRPLPWHWHIIISEVGPIQLSLFNPRERGRQGRSATPHPSGSMVCVKPDDRRLPNKSDRSNPTRITFVKTLMGGPDPTPHVWIRSATVRECTQETHSYTPTKHKISDINLCFYNTPTTNGFLFFWYFNASILLFFYCTW